MEKMKCEYKGDKIGIEGEVGETACEICDNEATKVLRLITIPQSQCQTKLLFKHLCICQGHAEYLCNDAEFKWENLPNTNPEEEMKIRDSHSKRGKE